MMASALIKKPDYHKSLLNDEQLNPLRFLTENENR